MRKKPTILESEGLTKVAKKGKGIKGGNQGIGTGGPKVGGCSEGPIEAKNEQLLLGVPLEFPQGSQAWSRVEPCTSTFHLSYCSCVRLPVEVTQ